jgi:hypothetical protein
VRLTAWMRQSEAKKFKVLATMCDKEEALLIGFSTVWPEAKQQLCQEHFIGSLSEPVQQADQQLQGDLQAQLRGLPHPPQLKGEVRDENVMAGEQQAECAPIKAEERGAEPAPGFTGEAVSKKRGSARDQSPGTVQTS